MGTDEDILAPLSLYPNTPPADFHDIDAAVLRRDGLATFSVHMADVEDVARIYRRMRRAHAGFRRCRPSAAPVSRRGARANVVWTEEIPFRTEASGFPIAVPPPAAAAMAEQGGPPAATGAGAMAEEGEALAFEVYTTGAPHEERGPWRLASVQCLLQRFPH
jgi:hypothetical protein